MKQLNPLDELRLGVCYYPEHWEESLWEADLLRMKELGFSIIRIAEFAWAIFEPKEGRFSFDLFDRFLELAAKLEMKVIMGTPTATPPAWLTHKYPEVLNATFEGVTLQHGLRRHNNYSSPKYRELSARITLEMAKHYADHPAIIGWQIDNEFNCEVSVFYADADHIAFRQWLKEKYDTLDALNKAWGTVFWSQTYSDWEQVFLPRPTAVGYQPNPHQALDEKRFISDNTIAFAKIQADILREHAPRHWVTTNGMFGHLDNHRMNDELLDFFSYDSYPQFSTIFYDANEQNPLADRGWSLSLSAVRSISPNFAIMEQQAGPGGWVNRIDMPSPKPGQMRLWTYQSIAHGADMVLYFRWRTATFGNEMYWHGLHDYDNRPNRRVREAGKVGSELAAIGDRIVGSRFQADVAIVRDYDNEWDGEYDVWHGPYSWKSGKEWFKALQKRHIPSDVVYLRSHTTAEELKRYRVLVYPHPAIMRDETAAMLEQYVWAGGTVIFGCRTGYKDERGHCYMRPLPGAAAALCGIRVEEFTKLNGNRKPALMQWKHDGGPVTAAEDFNDILEVTASGTVEVMAEYASDYYAGKPAVTRNTFGGDGVDGAETGAGAVWYYGAVFNEDAAGQIIELMGLRSPAADWAELPAQVELAIRAGASGMLAFLLNYGEAAAQITLKKPMKELLTGTTLSAGEVELEPFGVYVLEIG
ncbi:beta-galactosidase [Paenibacillus radicis (ex Gao et al. 2016)]|uniref:Beta-galactosidase n=1 Tax=Paenibacillus radicis (ex Gao et al. 2016) TaxID=1737354 RepID=A0A917GXR6_9BACL|nr:beta-galactosidase [Paenibacillus radicis (ex Gao et al. 2016)]GGG60579.1 beta-galactosidase [Paenibacillus radicis (ex Gao et al. 2016)]